MRSPDALDRLSSQDLSSLRVEARGVAMHVAALAILDGARLRDPEGERRLQELRAEVERRLHLAPRLRQVLVQPPFGGGRPLWVDDARFDISKHVRTRAVDPPGDEGALLAACAELDEPPLDRSRPPWELWFLTGLADGGVGMLIRLHHVVADGVASVALLGSLFDAPPGAPAIDTSTWVPAPPPPARAMRIDNAHRRAAAARRACAGLVHPDVWSRRLVAQARAAKDALGGGRAPDSSINVPVAGRRRISLARADLERAREVAHAHGGTINDVVLAAVAGGARALLGRRGEAVAGGTLRASVPVSIRGSADRPSDGNLVALMVVSLPVGEPDPARRLQTIARETTRLKRRPHATGSLPGPAVVQRAVVAMMHRQRLVNLFTSNVPGPPTPVSFVGAPVREVFQIGVVQGNVAIAVGALSYAGRLNIDVVADAAAVPDLEVFADGLRRSLDELGVAVPRA